MLGNCCCFCGLADLIATLYEQAAVEEGIVAGGGSTLLKLAQKVDDIIATLENDEQKVGAEIVRRALSYPLKLIANNAGVNGSVVVQKVRSHACLYQSTSSKHIFIRGGCYQHAVTMDVEIGSRQAPCFKC